MLKWREQGRFVVVGLRMQRSTLQEIRTAAEDRGMTTCGLLVSLFRRSQKTVRIPPELHAELSAYAAGRGLTLREAVQQGLDALKKEKQHET